MKNEFGHDLLKAYKALPVEQKVLSADRLNTLRVANDIYRGKGFEYFSPEHALRGYSPFPELGVLDAIAAELIAQTANEGKHPPAAERTAAG